MLNNLVDFGDLKLRMEGGIRTLRTHLGTLRTGRASSNLLDSIMLEAYGQSTPINQIGTISVTDPRTLSLQIWDKSVVNAAQKAIQTSGLGLNPMVDGTTLRICLPDLNEERRQELVKLAHKYAEEARVAIRHVRRDGMDGIKKAEKDGDIGKDDAHNRSEAVQKLTDSQIAEIERIISQKETEIMQV